MNSNYFHVVDCCPPLSSYSPLLSDSRSMAEINMYKLIAALKEQYTRHPMIHTFTRILSIVNGALVNNDPDNEELEDDEDDDEIIEIKNSNDGGGKRLNKFIKDNVKTIINSENLKNKPKKKKKFVLSDCSISLSISTVYLYARSCLLRDYTGKNYHPNSFLVLLPFLLLSSFHSCLFMLTIFVRCDALLSSCHPYSTSFSTLHYLLLLLSCMIHINLPLH
jgi:hypothetical protein